MATTALTEKDIRDHRIEQIADLGFDREDAAILSDRFYTKVLVRKGGERYSVQVRVDSYYIRRMLDGGASREQVLRILL